MLIKGFFSAALMFAGTLTFASSPMTCETSKPRAKPFGLISKTSCTVDGVAKRETINLNGVAVLSDKQLFQEDVNKDSSIRVYTSGASNPSTGCAPRLYLLDMRSQPVKVFSLGVKNACNEFHWASWGEKRSVIALKKNVSFVYENGKLTPPPAGAKLWNDIEAPHAGEGLKEEDAIPFVEELKLP